MSVKWRRTLLLLTAASLAVTLFMVHYSYRHDGLPLRAAQLAKLPPLEELNDPQNNGFRRIAHFGAKVEDVNRGNDFWKRAEKPPRMKVLNGKAFGDVEFYGAEEKESYPVKSQRTEKNPVKSVFQKNESEAIHDLPTTMASNHIDEKNVNFVENNSERNEQRDMWMENDAKVVGIKETEIEDFYPVKAKQAVETTKRIIVEPVVEASVNSSDLKSYFTRIPRIDGENIIAMSLYGSNMRYTMGAIRNAELIEEIFPGWKLRIYTEAPSENPRFGLVPQTVISKLRELSAEIHFMLPGEGFIPPMMWRFLVADDLWVDHFIIRDSDARLTDRDAAAVYAWVKSEKPFNCIRDHPSHAGYAISGGMWGAKPQMLYSILRRSWKDMMRGVRTEYLQDMNFLNYVVWPKVEQHAYCSDSVSCDQWPGAHPFPVPRLGYEHVGQVVNEHDLGRPIDIQILRTAGENAKCVPQVNIRDLLRNQS